MDNKNAKIEFKVVARLDGNVFQFDKGGNSYQFSEISLSGYHGELALHAIRGETVDIIREGTTLSYEPLVVSQSGYEGHVVFFKDVPDEIAALLKKECDGTHFLAAQFLNDADVVRLYVRNNDHERASSISNILANKLGR